MAEREELPEEIVLNIFSRLPVKSLIRFSSVSKRLHFIIFSDPKFALSHFKAARLSRRLLVSNDVPRVKSLPLDHDDDTPLSVRNLRLPFLQQQDSYVELLGSCNGLVFVSVDDKSYYIWNPSISLFTKLPDHPGFELNDYMIDYYGVGYLSLTDDYNVLVSTVGFHDAKRMLQMFSSRTYTWDRIESTGFDDVRHYGKGIHLNEALHWLNYNDKNEMVCFDVGERVFRRMPLPNIDHDVRFSVVGVCGGCLCVLRYPHGACDSVNLWVMREYEVRDSWTMLFDLKLSDPPGWPLSSRELLVVENSIVAAYVIAEGFELIRIDLKEDRKIGRYILEESLVSMVEYEESLLWISSYHHVEENEQVQSRSRSNGLRIRS